MALFTVIRIFVLSILFNIMLPSGDVYSDIVMTYQTWTFSNTESLELAGCKACYRKEVEDLVPSKKDCTLCVTKNDRFHCGGRLPSITKLLWVENGNECEDLKWGFGINEYGYYESGKCDKKKSCCFETKNEFSIFNKSIEDKEISKYLHPKLLVDCNNPVNPFLNDLAKNGLYDVCSLVGSTTQLSCGINVIDPNKNDIKNFIKEKNAVFVSKKFTGISYKLRVKENNSSSGLIEFMPFRANIVNEADLFECGIFIKPKHVNLIGDTLDVDCGLDSCKLHLDFLHYRSAGIHDLQSWKTKTVYWQAIKAGGKNCHLVRVYACSMFFPITINFIFSAMIFIHDVKSGVSRKYEIPVLFVLCYPQWRTFKILIKYFKHKKEEELTNDLEENNKNVSSIEPFCESGLQVSIL